MEKWRPAPEGKLDLLVNMDFRMSTTSIYSDIVLPAATFYEKNDINTTDMHSFIHPFVKRLSATILRMNSAKPWMLRIGIKGNAI